MQHLRRHYNNKESNLYNGSLGCTRCANESFTKTTEQFKEEVLEKLEGEYIITGEYINNKTPIEYVHTRCGKKSYASPNNLIRYRHKCSFCSRSSGELFIEKVLKDKGVVFETEKTFPDCISDKNYPYRFDFFIPDKNILIEYHGRQHYEPVEAWGGEEVFKRQQKADEYKKNYSIANNYIFIEIHYKTPKKDIKELLDYFLA